MWECTSGYGGPDPFYRKPGPPPIGIGCDMLGGASGGGCADRRQPAGFGDELRLRQTSDQLYGPKLTKKANRMRSKKAGREPVG